MHSIDSSRPRLVWVLSPLMSVPFALRYRCTVSAIALLLLRHSFCVTDCCCVELPQGPPPTENPEPSMVTASTDTAGGHRGRGARPHSLPHSLSSLPTRDSVKE